MEKFIYLDNNATTKTDEKVLEAMLPYFKEDYANPSSMYNPAYVTSRAIDNARSQIADFLGVENKKNIVFTSCGTESANSAIMSVFNKSQNPTKHIITTAVEHPCVMAVYEHLEKHHGAKATYARVNENGELDVENLLSKITPDTILVSIMHANNETGAIYPVYDIAKEVKKINKNIKVFVDGVQAAGKIPIELDNTDIDFYSISGHKFHAPKGIGALYIKEGTLFDPYILGGHQENLKRAGTENVPYIVGIGEASMLAKEALTIENTKVKDLRDKLEKGILAKIPNAKLNSKSKSRVPNTTNIGFEYIEGELILLYLNDLNICASSGSACTSGSLDPSHVLRAQKTPFTCLHGSIRFSLSRYTTEEEIDYVIEKLPGVINKLSKISPFQNELKELWGDKFNE